MIGGKDEESITGNKLIHRNSHGHDTHVIRPWERSRFMGGIFGKWWSKRRRGSVRRRHGSSKSASASRATSEVDTTARATQNDNRDVRREGVEMLRRATMTLSIGAGDATTDDGASVDTSRSRRRSRVGCLGWGGSWGGGLGALMMGWRGKSSSRSMHLDSSYTVISQEVGGDADDWEWSTTTDRNDILVSSGGAIGGDTSGKTVGGESLVGNQIETQVNDGRETVSEGHELLIEAKEDESLPLIRQESLNEDKGTTKHPREKLPDRGPMTKSMDMRENELDDDHSIIPSRDNIKNVNRSNNDRHVGKTDALVKQEDVEAHERLQKFFMAQIVQMELLWEYNAQLRRECRALQKMVRKLEGRKTDTDLLRKRAEALEEENELMKLVLETRRSERHLALEKKPEDGPSTTFTDKETAAVSELDQE